MAFLTREQITAARDLGGEAVEVPEWVGSVYVRMMTAGEHARLGVDVPGIAPEKQIFHLLSKTLCDEQGNPLFGDDAGVKILEGKSKEVILRLYKEVARVNKLGTEDVEGAAKN